jgi:hypothetical protein
MQSFFSHSKYFFRTIKWFAVVGLMNAIAGPAALCSATHTAGGPVSGLTDFSDE